MFSKDNTPTRDISTKKAYIKRMMNFFKKAYREKQKTKDSQCLVVFDHLFGIDIVKGLSLVETVEWACLKWSKKLSKESWRAYRAPFKFMAEIYIEGNLITTSEFDYIVSLLLKTRGVPKRDLSIRTSRKKQKHLKTNDLKMIDKELSCSKSVWSMPTRLWLRAGILTGLRPVEWRKCKLSFEKEKYVLCVKNAKNTNNRANGVFRHLNLNHLLPNDIKIIKNHVKISAKFSKTKDDWDFYYNGCSNLLRQKTRKVFPNRQKFPTLYSSRHQFSANSKASGCKPIELAALMGHASDLTAQTTYGKKTNGTRKKKQIVNKHEMATVRKNKKTIQPFVFVNGVHKKNK